MKLFIIKAHRIHLKFSTSNEHIFTIYVNQTDKYIEINLDFNIDGYSFKKLNV